MIFNYDAVYFGAPSGVEGIPEKPLMVLQNTPITLPNGTVVPRGMYVEMANIGYVHANRIYADSLSALTVKIGTLGTLTNGLLISDDFIKVFDPENGGVLRCQLGNLKK